jgi:hypothetical protein
MPKTTASADFSRSVPCPRASRFIPTLPSVSGLILFVEFELCHRPFILCFAADALISKAQDTPDNEKPGPFLGRVSGTITHAVCRNYFTSPSVGWP